MTIERPDITVAQITLLILSQKGRAGFRDIISHPLVRTLGTQRTENSFYTAFARLKRRRLIVRTDDRKYELTAAGQFAALKAFVRKEFTEQEKLQATNYNLSASVRWDGRWRLILFDVPENKRPIRDYIRNMLKRAGCYEFQRSTWIYPHKLPSFIIKTLGDPHLRQYTRIMTTYDVDYDEDLRKRFRLA